ncbi:hypothetical protein ACVWYF_003966 [Hymenobacter sp. UYAg731]
MPLKPPRKLLRHGPAYAQAPEATALGRVISPATLEVVREADASMSAEGWTYAPPTEAPAGPPAGNSH